MQTRQIEIGDVALSCNEVAGSGRPFLMLHGLTGHRDDFRPRMPELAGAGWLLAPDLRGHGDFTQTGRAETFTFEQLVADIDALLDGEGVEQFDLLGHSFGGMVALRYVLARPQRVRSLLLMDTAPSAPASYSVDTFVKAGAIARERGMGFLQELVEKAMRSNEAPPASDRQLRKWGDAYWPHMRRRYGAMDPVAYGAFGVLMMEQESVVPSLGEIECPTTVMVGADDTEFLAGADALTEGIPHARRVTLPDAGHHPQMENPEAWLAAVREHLGDRV